MLEEAEASTGSKYQLKIEEYKSNEKPLIIGDFRKRAINVYYAVPEYKELEGNYSSIDHLKKEIFNRISSDDYEETSFSYNGKEMGKCKKCHKYGDTKDNIITNKKGDKCMSCSTEFTSKWRGLEVDIQQGRIIKQVGKGLGLKSQVKGNFNIED
jgi:RNA polymerase subunit RPABC4/transcription elongation factor Spt4